MVGVNHNPEARGGGGGPGGPKTVESGVVGGEIVSFSIEQQYHLDATVKV